MASLNKVIVEMYQKGMSTTDIGKQTNTPFSRVRKIVLDSGIKLRTRTEGVRLAGKQGKLGKGIKRLSPEHIRKMVLAANKAKAEKAAGLSLKPNGYLEFTRGENKFRYVHVVAIERIIGRRILPNEVVHHKDGNRSNNNLSNLELMTRGAHSRLHRNIDIKTRQREDNGRFVTCPV